MMSMIYAAYIHMVILHVQIINCSLVQYHVMATYTTANIIIPHDSQQSVATWFAARYPQKRARFPVHFIESFLHCKETVQCASLAVPVCTSSTVHAMICCVTISPFGFNYFTHLCS